ncbi:RmlC-like cupin domain-containing protein [Penicillium lagena]|uniref:RmlC-like cupin domain-containing protein n=1 Tax=Penicillium lagena TaxID=94218 RepID=UPI00253FF28D|nr:RmlC-like cupin domain-containing protein [Penicillium lagena]KAJ5613435.1 RmlC-like cupin domain-containing protein [Penicillium lagena]
MMTIYPRGSFHTQVNRGYEPAGFAATFTAEDYGMTLVANQTYAMSDDIIVRTFGQSIVGEDIGRVRDAIPKTALIMVEECLSKCGKKKNPI